jgi:hypothetical protein
MKQAWEGTFEYQGATASNGGSILSNCFYGTVTAVNGSNAGGIIGYMNSMNKYNVIENNYYLDTCGAGKGIGGAYYIDTQNAVNDSGVAAATLINGVYYVNTSLGNPGVSGMSRYYVSPGTSASTKSHARTDDPLGADADNLAKAVTAAEMKDGTALALLNAGAGISENWEQGDKYPVFTTLRGYYTNIWDASASSLYITFGKYDEYGEATLIAAVYDGTRLYSAPRLIPVTESGEITVSLTVPDGGIIKYFLWDKTDNLIPLCGEKLVQ